MGNRSFHRRRIDRLHRLEERLRFLEGRLAAGCAKSEGHARQEISALKWVVEEVDRLDLIEQALADPGLHTDFARLAAIAAAVSSRHAPTDADIERTKSLAEQYGWATATDQS